MYATSKFNSQVFIVSISKFTILFESVYLDLRHCFELRNSY